MACPCCAPGECDCPDECPYQLTVSGEALTVSVEATAAPDECEECEGATDEDSAPNPLNEEEQVGEQEVTASASVPGFGSSFADGAFDFSENYAVNEPGGYTYSRDTLITAGFVCRKVGDVATWFMSAGFLYSESRSEYDSEADPTVVVKTQSSIANLQIFEVPIKVVCPADPVTWTVVVGFDGVTVNGVSYDWVPESSSFLQQSCTENGSPCNDYLANYTETATFVLTRKEECEFP